MIAVIGAGSPRARLDSPKTLAANASTSSERPLVINLGIAKTGTSSLQAFFECNGWRAVHNTGCGGKRCYSAVRSFLDDVPYNAGRQVRTFHFEP